MVLFCEGLVMSREVWSFIYGEKDLGWSALEDTREREVISGSYRKVTLESYILSKVKFTTNLNIKFYKICKIYM